ncbi:Mediator of RNA polymerase II transcription subunit 18 [Rhizina undulata]
MPPPNVPHFQNSTQELSLHSHIPASRKPQLLRILSGITGMVPENMLNHHLIYKPKRLKTYGPGPGNAELYYIQLVAKIDKESSEDAGYEARKQKWTMKLEDLPEVTRKPVISRAVLSSEQGQGDALEFMESLGYTFQATYFNNNYRLIHNNIVLTLSQILLPPAPADLATNPDAIFGSPFPRSELKPLDHADSWILQATIRVQTNTDVESINNAVNELKTFKELLKGVCDLDLVERFALDTRVR